MRGALLGVLAFVLAGCISSGLLQCSEECEKRGQALAHYKFGGECTCMPAPTANDCGKEPTK